MFLSAGLRLILHLIIRNIRIRQSIDKQNILCSLGLHVEAVNLNLIILLGVSVDPFLPELDGEAVDLHLIKLN